MYGYEKKKSTAFALDELITSFITVYQRFDVLVFILRLK